MKRIAVARNGFHLHGARGLGKQWEYCEVSLDFHQWVIGVNAYHFDPGCPWGAWCINIFVGPIRFMVRISTAVDR